MPNPDSRRRGFLRRLATVTGFSAASAAAQSPTTQSPSASPAAAAQLPDYARAMNHKSLKQSSFDRTGGNSDRWPIAPGATQELFRSDGPGIITHIWFTIAAQSPSHLKDIVIRAYWEGNSKPSVEVPVGDFFGLNLGQYCVYQSAYLNCSSVKALNCYFAMPFRRSARITATNEGSQPVGSFYSNIDYKLVPSLPDDIVYFHAQYRQSAPNPATKFAQGEKELNTDGKTNYVFAETRGKGHLMGITMGVLQNTENWFGEGDDMIFIDDESKPAIIGTGTEDYINGAWDFGGRDGAIPFAHLYNGAQFMQAPEHGHANDRPDNFYSVCYWYQTQPYTDFPALPPVADRIPVLKS